MTLLGHIELDEAARAVDACSMQHGGATDAATGGVVTALHEDAGHLKTLRQRPRSG